MEIRTKINYLNKKIEERDTQIKDLNNRLTELENSNYEKDKQEYVKQHLSKIKRDTIWNIVLVVIIIVLLCLNEFYKSILPTHWSSIIAIASVLASTFGPIFFDKTKIKHYFCRKNLMNRLEQDFDELHKQ